ncbi:hypothetical protein J0S82_000214, partial [Galemys pyrenaicus]
ARGATCLHHMANEGQGCLSGRYLLDASGYSPPPKFQHLVIASLRLLEISDLIERRHLQTKRTHIFHSSPDGRSGGQSEDDQRNQNYTVALCRQRGKIKSSVAKVKIEKMKATLEAVHGTVVVV